MNTFKRLYCHAIFLELKAKKNLACKLITSSYAQPKYDPLSCSVRLVKVTFEPQLFTQPRTDDFYMFLNSYNRLSTSTQNCVFLLFNLKLLEACIL